MKFIIITIKYFFSFLVILLLAFILLNSSQVKTYSFHKEMVTEKSSINKVWDSLPTFYLKIDLNTLEYSLFPKIYWNSNKNKFHIWLFGNNKIMLGGIIYGDMGKSLVTGIPVLKLIQQNILWTLYLMFGSVFLIYTMGILLGMISYKNRNRWVDKIITNLGIIFHAIPKFSIAIILIFLFSNPSVFYWLSSSYGITYQSDVSTIKKILFWILPIISISAGSIGYVAMQMRDNIIQQSTQTYVSFAIVKGLSSSYIEWKHMFRNAVIPIISHLSTIIPILFSGSLIIEVIFSIPGMGKLMYESYLQRDYMVMNGIFLLLSLISLFSSYLLELFYIKVDSRRKQD